MLDQKVSTKASTSARQSIWQHSQDLSLGLGEEVRSLTSWDMKLACGVWYQCYSDTGINTCRRNATDYTCCAIFKHPFSPTRKYFRPKLLNCILLHGRDGKRVLRNTDDVGDELTDSKLSSVCLEVSASLVQCQKRPSTVSKET